MKRNFTRILAAFALLVGLTFPMGVWGQTSSTVTIQYTGNTTTNMTGNNDATLVGLSSTDWSVVGAKGASQNFPGLNKAGDIRLYYDENGSNTITVTNLHNNTISSIVITYTGVNYSNGKVLVNDNEVEASDGSYAINATSFVVTNGNTSNIQVRISSIVVTYIGGNTPQPDTYTITYKAGEGTGSDVTETKTEGVDYTILGQPEGFSAPTGKVFDGWLGDDNNSYVPGDTYSTDAALTLTAQWTENTTPGGDEQWVLTNLADLTENDVFVIVGNGYAMTNNNGTSSAPAASAVTIENDMITSNVASTIQWTVSGNATDGYTFHPNGSTTTWLYCNTTASSGSNNNMRVGTGNRKVFELTTKSNNDYLVTKDNNVARYVCVYSNSDWRGYVESSIVATNTTFYKKVTGGTVPPSIAAENVSIEYDATSGTITYTINNEPDPAGTLSANTTANWLTIGTVGETIPFTCSANAGGTAREGVVTLTYTYGDNQTVTKDVTVTQAGNPNAVMTIAEVRAQGTGSVATKGVVTSCVGTTGYIQDATAAICVYGKSLTVGDEIRVSGTLTTYHGLLEITDPQITVLSNGNTVSPTSKTIAEINADDYTLPTSIQGLYVTIEEATVTAINGQNTTIAQGENTIVVRGIYSNVSYNVNDVLTLDGNIGCYDAAQIANPQNVQVQAAPSITFDPDVVDLDAAQHLTLQVPFTYENLEIEDYHSFTVQFYDTNNEPTTKPDWIFSASVTGTNDEGYNVTLTVISANEGEARSCYFKVYVGETYSNLVTVNQAAYVAPFEPVLYTRATEIVSGQHYIIVGFDNEDHNNAYAMGEQKTNNRAAVLISEDGTTATVTSEAVYDFVIESVDGNYSIYDAINEGYLYAAGSGSNYLRTESELTNDSKWTIGFDASTGAASVVATASSNRNVMQFNYASNNQLFSCYATASQKPVYLYVKSDEAPSSYTLNVTGYGENEGGYVLIASPINNVNPATIEGMTTGDFDLYYFDQDASDGLEWINYEAGAFNLVSGKGYLYANSANVTLTFAGKPYTGNGQVPVIAGYNLVGNPYAVAANLSVPYYRLNASGSELSASTESSAVNAMEGVFVQATEAGSVTFTTSNSGNGKSNAVVMNLSRNRGTAIDNAIVRFDEGQQLPKFQLFENSTKLYIPQGNKDFAIVRSAAQGEMPVSFRASENGTYTIAVEAENVDMNYLHLIDNMTGADVDLLATPNYTFEARTNDYTSRFRLVFSAEENGASTDSATFAYFNGTSWTVSNTGDATLQVVDITGRIVSSETINGNATVSLNQPAGIYMLRLVNGNDVKVQKVVVR